MFGNLGFGELLVIMLFVLIFFGSKKIPDVMQGLGKGIKQFKDAMKDVEDSINIDDKKELKP